MTDRDGTTLEPGDPVLYRDPAHPDDPRTARVVRVVDGGRYRISLDRRSQDSPNRFAASRTDELDETMRTIGEGPLDPGEDLEVDGSTLEFTRDPRGS
jgi:hypothetical protein